MPQTPRGARRPRRRSKRVCQPVLRRRCGLRGCVLTNARRILGVDPGTRCAGWAVIAGSPYKPELIACGEIRLSEKSPLSDRFARLHAAIRSVVDQHVPSEAAVEAPFHGVSARSALQLAHARGVVLAALGSSGLRVFEYSPATIKKAVTGNGRAEKEQVEVMVSRLLAGGGSPGRSDIADAIAAALCHLFGTGRADALHAAGVVRPHRRRGLPAGV